MNLSKKQKNALFTVWDYCDDEDKSTEYMIAIMMDVSGLDYDEVVDFMIEAEDERDDWYKAKYEKGVIPYINRKFNGLINVLKK